jgi:tetratricopeptide (TPR) repeat protein
MGVVYEAFDRERRQPVALKILPRFDADGLYRFKQEFRTLADVHHPNLVHLYELVASETGEIFFTMELVNGTDFARYVQDPATAPGSTPPWAETTQAATVKARAVVPPDAGSRARATRAPPPSPANGDRLRVALRQLVQGVQAIHSAGKLHRDLKPSNVLVTPEGRLVILDFGVAADLSDVERRAQFGSGEIVGTASYMAPEQVIGDGAPDPASDWYSVGVMFYEALVGRPPFVGSEMDVLTLKNTMDPALPSECVEGIEPDMEALCVSLLRRDPGQRPTGGEILRALGVSQSSAPPGSHFASETNSALVGREVELRALREAAEHTRSGRSITVRIGGAPGMGKSTIAHHFLDQLEQNGEAVVLRGRAYEREAVPYKAVDGVIDALSRCMLRLADEGALVTLPEDIWWLGRLFPVLQRVPGVTTAPRDQPDDDAHGLRLRAFGALRELLATIAARQPLVLFVDDVQWGDADSAALLLELLGSPKVPHILLLMTYRDDEAGKNPFLAEMRDRWPEGAEVRDLTVGPLDLADAQRLAIALLDASDRMAQRLARAVAREARGSPFLVEELVRSNRDRIREDEDTLVVLTLDQVVQQRLARLPEGGRRMVEIIAVGGRPLPVPVVATASDINDKVNEVVALLGAGRLARTSVRDGCEVVEMTHDRIRETVVALLPAAVLRDHHRRLATALEATPEADLEAIAIHLLGAGDHDRAARFAERAAEQAASKFAFEQAARLFRLAIDTVEQSETDAHRLRVRLARMLESDGRSSDAADEYRRAAREATAIERIELERSAAEQLVLSGRIDEGALALRRVLAAMGMTAPRSALGALVSLVFYQIWQRVLGSRFRERSAEEVSRENRVRVETLRAVSAGLGAVDVILGASMQARHLVLAMRVGDRLQVLKAMCVELVQFAVAAHSVGNRELAMVEAAERLASRVGPEERLFFEGTRGLALYMRGRYEEALEALDAADAQSRKTRLRPSMANARLFAIYSCFFTGRLREEARRASVLLREVEDRGDVYTAVCLRSTVMVDIGLAADDPDGARRNLREAMSRWTQSGFNVQHWYAMWSEANIELYVGEGARARMRLDRDARALKRSFLLHSCSIRGFTAYLRGSCAIASIDADATLRLQRINEGQRWARQLEREPAAWSRTLGCLVRAAAENAAGESSRAIDALRAALQCAESAGMRLHGWAASHRLGALVGGDEGLDLVARAEEAMTAEGVRAPVRMAGLFLPGHWPPGPTL